MYSIWPGDIRLEAVRTLMIIVSEVHVQLGVVVNVYTLEPELKHCENSTLTH